MGIRRLRVTDKLVARLLQQYGEFPADMNVIDAKGDSDRDAIVFVATSKEWTAEAEGSPFPYFVATPRGPGNGT